MRTSRNFTIQNMIIFLLALIVSIIISDVIHESGHAFFGFICGMEITEFAPYPHVRSGELVMGYVDFANYDVPDNVMALMYIGSEIIQVIGFFISLGIYYFLNSKSKIPPSEGAEKYYKSRFIDYTLRLYSIWSFLDWPLYTITHALRLPHFFLFGGPWDEGDIYGFALHAHIYDYYWILIILAVIWLFLGSILIYYIQYYHPKFKNIKK